MTGRRFPRPWTVIENSEIVCPESAPMPKIHGLHAL
jgi:hypothetical protein